MKFIHLADLHIGKRIHGFSMLEDQSYILKRILEIVQHEMPDGVIISGDIYDKPVPPAEAVQVFDGFLNGLVGQGTAVFAVSGNHDSAERIAFGAGVMSGRRVYFSPVYDGAVTNVALTDAWGTVRVHLLPFLKPAHVNRVFGEGTAANSAEAVAAALSRAELAAEERHVLVAHQFVAGSGLGGSEELAVGDADQVGAGVFAGFDYTALGHIHRPQAAGCRSVRYSGSPLAYSFSEAGQEKSVTVVELFEKGHAEIREIALTPLRRLRRIRGTYMELTARDFYAGMNTSDYILAVLTDEEDVLDAMARLRVIYPNLMCLEYDNRRTRQDRQIEGSAAGESRSELEQAETFYELQNNGPMSEIQRSVLKKLLTQLGAGPQKEGPGAARQAPENQPDTAAGRQE